MMKKEARNILSNFPFFGFPYHNYYRRNSPMYSSYNASYYSNRNMKQVNFNNSKGSNSRALPLENSTRSRESNNSYDSRGQKNIAKKPRPFWQFCEDDPVLEILGIKLYSDDLLIIGLLFFLYTEGVKDELLFICLILLLLG